MGCTFDAHSGRTDICAIDVCSVSGSYTYKYLYVLGFMYSISYLDYWASLYY